MVSHFPKDKLIFVTHYLGSLRYFEKLLPYLSNKYEIAFLFMPQTQNEFRKEMKSYCDAKAYNYIAFSKFQAKRIGSFVPFLNPLLDFFNLKKQTKKLLADKAIKKIVSVFDGGSYNYFLTKANKVGVETFVLQWAATNRSDISRRNVKPKLSQIGFYGYLVYYLKTYLLKTSFKTNFLGGGASGKLGVINEYTADFFKKAGVKKDKITIVGYADFDLTRNLKQEIISNSGLRNQLAQKNGFDLTKKNILLYSTLFHKKDIKIFGEKDALAYYENIIKIIREYFPAEKANILFKIHPAGTKELYQPFKKYDVKILGKDYENHELIALSDLYIAHHSTTNFIAILFDIPAIFLNLLNLPTVDETAQNFGINYFIKTENDFRKKLSDFKNNRLEKQYTFNQEIFPENCFEKIINWIN